MWGLPCKEQRLFPPQNSTNYQYLQRITKKLTAFRRFPVLYKYNSLKLDSNILILSTCIAFLYTIFTVMLLKLLSIWIKIKFMFRAEISRPLLWYLEQSRTSILSILILNRTTSYDIVIIMFTKFVIATLWEYHVVIINISKSDNLTISMKVLI